jgi:hypothetical protein
MAIYEDVLDEDTDFSFVEYTPPVEDPTPPSNPLEVETLIFLNYLVNFSSSQTFKIIGYIRNSKFIILFDSGNTHKFIHRRISQETLYYISAIKKIQIMIANGGSMKCGGHCENVFLQIGHYHLKNHMFSIDTGYFEIFLGV